jgi:acyl-CoA ligase (AMP-forming) (exosortase A-associated)
MTQLLHELLRDGAGRFADRPALGDKAAVLSYGALDRLVDRAAAGFAGLGLKRHDRVAVFSHKQVEAVAAMFGASRAGGVFVPVNPTLKPRQVAYILADCNVRVLVTTADRLAALREVLGECPDLQTVLLLPGGEGEGAIGWEAFLAGGKAPSVRLIDSDMAAILYTSGSTGNPKGVVLSHRNMVVGATSVSTYLENTPEDRILSVLPLSFDYGLSQLTTAFRVGAFVHLLNYLLPRDVLKALVSERITGLACVPPLWLQLADLDWHEEIAGTLRYVTNSGGKMPRPVTESLMRRLPSTKIYLMYGLTEAFRSTYLPPSEVEKRPESMGKAIPHAEILVVGKDGEPCPPGVAGELVHRGPLVAHGYWNDPARTAERFKPAPGQPKGITVPEIAVWSGDTVVMDEEGYLYFVGRDDEMIKTSGYRVSPTEIEDVLYASGLVSEAVALGVPHQRLGQAVVVLAVGARGALDLEALTAHCRRELPNFMVPSAIVARESLPRNPNGKIDRKALSVEVADTFREEA